MEIKRIGVIGAGQMGSGIAHVCALKGFDIRLMDVDQPHINSGVENIGRNMDRQIGRGMIRPEDKDAALRRITTGTDFKQFADCDLIVEAATENEQIKRDIRAQGSGHASRFARARTAGSRKLARSADERPSSGPRG